MADDNGTMEKRQSEDGMSLNEVMDRWHQNTEDLSHDHHRRAEPDLNDGISNVPHEDDEDPNDKELPRLEEYRRLIQGAPTYRWLISNIQNDCTLFTPGDDIAKNVRDIVFESLPAARRVSRKTPTDTHNVCFRVNWDPVHFLLKEEYEEEPEEAIERALTFTGAGTEVQAETCGRYMRRTWPSTGGAMIQILKYLVSAEHKGSGR
jgi:hypothetical protein